jgi:hypothetical protein
MPTIAQFVDGSRVERLRSPLGVLPPCIRHRPLAIAPFRHGFPVRREYAPQRGLKCIGNLFCMELFLPVARERTSRLHWPGLVETQVVRDCAVNAAVR